MIRAKPKKGPIGVNNVVEIVRVLDPKRDGVLAETGPTFLTFLKEGNRWRKLGYRDANIRLRRNDPDDVEIAYVYTGQLSYEGEILSMASLFAGRPVTYDVKYRCEYHIAGDDLMGMTNLLNHISDGYNDENGMALLFREKLESALKAFIADKVDKSNFDSIASSVEKANIDCLQNPDASTSLTNQLGRLAFAPFSLYIEGFSFSMELEEHIKEGVLSITREIMESSLAEIKAKKTRDENNQKLLEALEKIHRLEEDLKKAEEEKTMTAKQAEEVKKELEENFAEIDDVSSKFEFFLHGKGHEPFIFDAARLLRSKLERKALSLIPKDLVNKHPEWRKAVGGDISPVMSVFYGVLVAVGDTLRHENPLSPEELNTLVNAGRQVIFNEMSAKEENSFMENNPELARFLMPAIDIMEARRTLNLFVHESDKNDEKLKSILGEKRDIVAFLEDSYELISQYGLIDEDKID